jgi:hypothetical protein
MVRFASRAPAYCCSMNTELATSPSRQQLAARDRSKPHQVTGKLKTVLDAVVNEGADPYEAGRIEGMHARSIRLALAKPHVLSYLRSRRQVVREQAPAQNLHHMIKKSDTTSNEMAKLGAMKLLEGVDDERIAGRGAMSLLPGLQIVIVAQSRGDPREPGPMIDVTPIPEPQHIAAEPVAVDQEAEQRDEPLAPEEPELVVPAVGPPVRVRSTYRAPADMQAAPRDPWIDG